MDKCASCVYAAKQDPGYYCPFGRCCKQELNLFEVRMRSRKRDYQGEIDDDPNDTLPIQGI